MTALAVLSLLSCRQHGRPSVEWREGEDCHAIVIRSASGLTGDWSLWFSMLPDRMEFLSGDGARLEKVMANVCRIVPEDGLRRDSVVVYYKGGPLKRRSWAPEGFVLRQQGQVRPLPVTYAFLPLPSDGPDRYEANARRSIRPAGPEDIIPLPKQIRRTGGTTRLSRDMVISAPPAFGDAENYLIRHLDLSGFSADGASVIRIVQTAEGRPSGWYRLVVDGDVTLEAADGDGAFHAAVSLANIAGNTPDGTIPNMEIEDAPDLAYRGAMIDVARNFTAKENLFRLIDIFARYKVNYLHLHLSDDEGWRLAVDGLDELVSVGAFHALPEVAADGSLVEERGLMPSYDGNADRDSDALSNGFYSRADMVEILRYAAANRIRVIPEFDMPGHSRAAIKAMTAYEKRTGDTRFRLNDPADTSRYCSAQDYTDNVLCVALPSVYRFIEYIVDEVVGIYAEAGVPLEAVHLGGDEVPDGAWEGSPACRAFMAENGLASAAELRAYFIGRIAGIVAGRGLRLAGWEEMTQGLSAEIRSALRPVLFFANCWNTFPDDGDERPYAIANDGFPIVLSNVTNTYADQVYTASKMEIGHSWACILDERAAFALLPFDVYKSVRRPDGSCPDGAGKEPLRREDKLLGVQAQMFTETVRSFDDLCYDLFPKILGVFERGWNARPDWGGSDDPAHFDAAFDRFYGIVAANEMPFFDRAGIHYRLPLPGVRERDGILEFNAPLSGADYEAGEEAGTWQLVLRGKKSIPVKQ